MRYRVYCAYPQKHNGLFHERHEVLTAYKQKRTDFKFFNEPSASQIQKYFQLIKQNQFSKEYIGDILTHADPKKSIKIIKMYRLSLFKPEEPYASISKILLRM